VSRVKRRKQKNRRGTKRSPDPTYADLKAEPFNRFINRLAEMKVNNDVMDRICEQACERFLKELKEKQDE